MQSQKPDNYSTTMVEEQTIPEFHLTFTPEHLGGWANRYPADDDYVVEYKVGPRK